MSKLTSTIVTMALAVTVFSLSGSSAMAQFGNRIQQPFDRPAFSPYMNLFRNSAASGGNAISNYYGLVRPQQEFYQQQSDLQQGMYNFQRGGMQQRRPGTNNQFPRGFRMGVTGHTVGFMTIGRQRQGGSVNLAGMGQQQGADPFGGASSASNQFDSGGGIAEDNSFSGGSSFSGNSAAFGYGGGYNFGGGF